GEAEASLVRAETELANLPFQIRTAEARMDLARTDLENKKRTAVSGASSQITLLQAQSEHDRAAAAVEELKNRKPLFMREVEALMRKRDALQKRRELKTDERRAAAEAEAAVKTAEARVQQAQTALDAANLRLERMVVRAMQKGRVLGLVARPGS